MRQQVHEAGAAGIVVGLSGGIDSAVVGALARRAFPDRCLGLIMPCHSDPADEADARLLAEHEGIPWMRVDLTPVYDRLAEALERGEPSLPPGTDAGTGREVRNRLAAANVKPRLRMMTVYYWANRLNYLVAGTGNRSELYVGYFTKYGDGGVDLLPLGNLVKRQVYALAEFLGIPERIRQRPPSAGLWPAQTDEAEMGLTYAVLDGYLLTGQASPDARERIERLHDASAHKRSLPPIAPVDWPPEE
ncbi:MAG: NAD(+) synthase [Firmicutes bacterium]|nr:NAD(+) synthase [Bacillota bacterium]